jgi:hypothetical protein
VGTALRGKTKVVEGREMGNCFFESAFKQHVGLGVFCKLSANKADSHCDCACLDGILLAMSIG